MQFRWISTSLVLGLALCAVSLPAQVMYPGSGMGLPVPSWLKGTRVITGHIGGIDPGKIMVRTLDVGNVLFTVDEKTKVHIDKTQLTLADLREEDAVAVRLKDIKDKGPYATEIMPHPDVLRRKERGGTPDALPSATELPAAPPEEKAAEKAGPPVKLGSTPASTAAAPAPERATSAPPSPAATQRRASTAAGIPSLPAGRSGITGTIVALKNDEATLEMPGGQRRTVLVTSVTRILRAGTTDSMLEEVRVGDRVAIVGDSLDTGLYVAREILVNRPGEGEAAPAVAESAPPVAAEPRAKEPSRGAADSAVAVKSDPETKSLTGTFTGLIESAETDALHVKTSDGRVRNVVVTPLTVIKKWNADLPFQALRKGDEIKVVGDLLDDGSTLARELTVTKPAPAK
jgi:hypothetical protein